MNTRKIAFEIIIKSIKDETYSNLLMRSKLDVLSLVDRSFCTNLVNGVLRNFEFLSYQYEDLIEKRISFHNKIILNMALYERFYLKKEDYVIDSEYSKLVHSKYDKSFISAILHNVNYLKTPKEDHIRCCLPSWIYDLLLSQYGDETLKKIVSVYRRIPKVYYRVNKKEYLNSQLRQLMIDDDFFVCDDNLINSDFFKNGLFYVQDYNSGQLYKHLDLTNNCTLLDVCSAPGGKLFNCLDIVDENNVYANDIYEHRINLIKDAASRLGYKNINYICKDGRQLKDIFNFEFDRILLDAPCSGLGVIGRKPDLKFHIKPNNLDELEILQYELLDSLKPLLKKNGILLYSTCTLNKKENSKLISRFIESNHDFKVLEEDTIINDLGDCFYYCKLTKV